MEFTTEMNMTSNISGNSDSNYSIYVEIPVEVKYITGVRYWMEHVYAAFYNPKHVYVSYIIRIFGMITNILNVVVYTRTNMQSAINSILTSLAVSDFVMLVTYENYFHSSYLRTYPEAVVQISFMNIFYVSSAISVWLTVVAAAWRVMHVCYPASTERWRSAYRARVAIISSCAACILACTPLYIMHRIKAYEKDGELMYKLRYSKIILKNLFLFFDISSWLTIVIQVIIPSCLLIVLTIMLINAICKADKNRARLNLRSEQDKARGRTTKMLIVMIMFFFLAYVPTTVIYILSMLGVRYSFHIQISTTKVAEDLALLNSSFNFLLYYSMSSQFRETFVALIRKLLKMCKAIGCTKHAESTDRAVRV